MDVRNKIVVPGGIEPHCHIGPAPEQMVPSYADPLKTTKGVVFGGVTTIFDFSIFQAGIIITIHSTSVCLIAYRVFVRGQIIVKDRQLVGKQGYGQLLKRKVDSAVLSGAMT